MSGSLDDVCITIFLLKYVISHLNNFVLTLYLHSKYNVCNAS